MAERVGDRPEFLPEAKDLLEPDNWPGNVRELGNALERKAVLSEGPVIRAETLPERLREPPTYSAVDESPPADPTMEVVGSVYIQRVLRAEEGNKTRGAEVFGIYPSTLYRKISRYGLGDS